MEEILRLVTVAEYDDFKMRVMQGLKWTRMQYSDRKQGRIKTHPLEIKEMYRILNDMRKEQAEHAYDIEQKIYCAHCEHYSCCPFEKIEDCPMYKNIRIII